jgi:S-adenosylmethionine/arginine decarboxylase-like enzyme
MHKQSVVVVLVFLFKEIMEVIHRHLIVRAETKKTPTDRAWTHGWLQQLVGKIGMKICQGPITSYIDVPGNRGITGVVIIETSHIALHIWDEPDPGLIQLDVYTCGPFDPQIIFDELKAFDPVKVEYKYLDREHELKEVKL